MSSCITGWAHSKFGVNTEQTSENMIADVVEKAIEHSEISAKEIDAIFVGTFNNGFQKQDFHGALPRTAGLELVASWALSGLFSGQRVALLAPGPA